MRRKYGAVIRMRHKYGAVIRMRHKYGAYETRGAGIVIIRSRLQCVGVLLEARRSVSGKS